jgi:hypothetical protein
LETIAENNNNSELAKDMKQDINSEYACIKNLSMFIIFNDMSTQFGLDSHVLVKIVNTFASHVSLPKEDSNNHVEPSKPPDIMHVRNPSANSVAPIVLMFMFKR